MKISLSLFSSVSLVLALFVTNVAQAQYAQSFNDYGPVGGASQPFSADLYYGGQPGGGYGSGVADGGVGGRRANGLAGRPGRLWVRGSFADQGLGYSGHYFTVGVKSQLHEDRFDGRWLFEGRVHHSFEEDGGFFSNIGLERVFSIDAANADVSLSLWYDYDGDARGAFAHKFNQIGASAQIKTPKWDLIGNGYFPVGTTDYSFGTFNEFGWDCFAGNRIIVLPGIDSALQGFDTVLRFRPAPLAMVNGTIDLGGYHYRSDLVPAFAGGKARLGLQFLQGVIVSAEVNHDDRFETTGVVSVGWLFGANASGRGLEYSRLGRDLDSVSRNDHIVRFNREAVVLMDPLTGLPYNVIHVDNLADSGIADGSYERPFATLLDGETNSNTYDVIAVHYGDGTDRNMQDGIVLKDYQRLWGTGTEYLIPSADGTFFELCGSELGLMPTISNAGGSEVVTLANFNDIAGINIDATGATHGVFGSGVNSGSVRESNIRNANSDGVRIENAGGDWLFDNNLAENNAGNGFAIHNLFDATSNVQFRNNTASNNLMGGIRVQDTALESLEFYGNTTSENLGDGLHVNNFTNMGTDPLMIVDHVSEDNAGRGIMLDTGTGGIRIFNTTSTGNTGSGLTVANWHHANPSERVVISSRNGGESNFSGNGALGNIEFLLDQPSVVTNALVTATRLDDGVRGVFGRANALDAILNIDIIDNTSISNNVNDGIRLLAANSGTVNTNIGSTHVNFAQDILGNALGGGAGISLLAQGDGGGPESVMNAVVSNVRINNAFNVVPLPGPVLVVATTGVEVGSVGNALSNVQILDSEIGAPNTIGPLDGLETQIGVSALFANDGHNLVNRLTMNNLTLFNEIGLFASTDIDTFSDITVANSVFRPSGIQSDGSRGDNTPFLDNRGQTGILVQAIGQADVQPVPNRTDRPDIDPLFSGAQLVSDGVMDNLTRVTILNNDIADFHENGIEINSFGDAQMLVNLIGNTVTNNGAGYNSDSDNDNVYGEPGDDTVVDIDHLRYFDGVRLHAYDHSTFSTNIFQNTFVDNFERGLRINTFNQAIVNASLRNNVFFGNDRGEDVDNTVPDLGTGIFANGGGLGDSGEFDFEAVNNAEYYIRPYESPILLNGAGVPIDLFGVVLPGDTLGVFYPGNTGFDIFGNPVAQGMAQLNLSLSNNAFQLSPPDLLDFSIVPGGFNLGLDGVSNGFTHAAFPGLTPVVLSFADALIDNETNFFLANGF